MKKLSNIKVFGLTAVCALLISSQAIAEGSRYDLPRDYTSEISSAKAFMEMEAGESVLIDVRRLREYRAGHPFSSSEDDDVHAYNVPYPHVVGSGDANAQEFYDEVLEIVGYNVDTPITTLCRTGYRSVLAANILTNPTENGVPNGIPFTNVRNIWQGFVGRYLEAYVAPIDDDALEEVGNSGLVKPSKKGVKSGVLTLLEHEALHHNNLDLDNDGVLAADMADVCTDTTDNNPDKDGWRNHQELSWIVGAPEDYAYSLAYKYGGYPECVTVGE